MNCWEIRAACAGGTEHAALHVRSAAWSGHVRVSVNSSPPRKSTFGRALASLATLALPPTCCLCGAWGGRDLRGAPLDLCDICRVLLPRNAIPCVRCAIPVERPGTLCAACARAAPVFDAAVAPYLYAYPAEHLVRGLKFAGQRLYGRVLGQLLAAACLMRNGPRPEVLVPVPLHAARYRQRGFNQAHEIARFAGCTLGIAVDPGILVRVAATREQSGLSLRERKINVRGAFALRRQPHAAHVALVDDVLTTGSTASEAARVLKSAGVGRVEVWAVARVTLAQRSTDVPDISDGLRIQDRH